MTPPAASVTPEEEEFCFHWCSDPKGGIFVFSQHKPPQCTEETEAMSVAKASGGNPTTSAASTPPAASVTPEEEARKIANAIVYGWRRDRPGKWCVTSGIDLQERLAAALRSREAKARREAWMGVIELVERGYHADGIASVMRGLLGSTGREGEKNG